MKEDPMWPRTPGEKREVARLEAAVDRFAEAMKTKLASKADDGWRGWGDKKNRALLERKMMDHVKHPGVFARSNLIDVANFCLFLWTMGRGEEA